MSFQMRSGVHMLEHQPTSAAQLACGAHTLGFFRSAEHAIFDNVVGAPLAVVYSSRPPSPSLVAQRCALSAPPLPLPFLLHQATLPSVS